MHLKSFSEYKMKNKKVNENVTNGEKNTEKYENIIKNYEKLSDNELLNEFLRITYQKKREGKLTENELKTLSDNLIPYLDDKQKEQLKKVLEIVKNV